MALQGIDVIWDLQRTEPFAVPVEYSNADIHVTFRKIDLLFQRQFLSVAETTGKSASPLYTKFRMRRYILWYVLALFWGAIALVGLVRHRLGNAALEGAVAILFIVIGIAVKRRDAATIARYTANRPK